MGTFVTNPSETLPGPKTGTRTVPEGADANEYFVSADYNALRGAANDLRDAVLNFNLDVTATGSSTGRSLAARFAEVANVRDFGAVADGSTDDTAAIQAAVDTGRRAVVPAGTYRVAGTVVVGGSEALHLAAGATLIRPSGDTSTDPVVRLGGNQAQLTGEGGAAWVKTEKASPRGVVCVGPPTIATLTQVNYTRVSGISFFGVKAAGNVGLWMDSSEVTFGDGTTYAGLAENLYFQSLDEAVHMDVLVDAWAVRDVFTYEVNTTFRLIGALENSFHGGFTHHAGTWANPTMIRLESGSEGNVFLGVSGEMGGNSTYSTADATSRWNLLIGYDNSANGNPDASGLNSYHMAGWGTQFKNDRSVVFSNSVSTSTGSISSAGGFFAAADQPFGTYNAAPVRMRGSDANGGTAVGVKLGNANALTTSGARSVGFYSDDCTTEVAAVQRNASGVWGIRLKSPDGTWYLLTVANGGTVNIAAAP